MPHPGAAIAAVQTTALPAQLGIPDSYLWLHAAPFPQSLAPSARPSAVPHWPLLQVSVLPLRRFEGPPVVPLTPSLTPASAVPEACAALRWAPTWGAPHALVSAGPPPSSTANSAATTTAHSPRSIPTPYWLPPPPLRDSYCPSCPCQPCCLWHWPANNPSRRHLPPPPLVGGPV